MHNPVTDLQRRFAESLLRAGATDAEGVAFGALFDELVALYSSPGRHYHSLAHLSACLGWLDWVGGHAERPAEVALALWFHDAIYDPERDDNEEQSAALARRCLKDLGVGEETVARIAAHVLATRRHDGENGDARLVVDIDLTILGASPRKFDAFEEQIRQEYVHVPTALFEDGRRRVLERFLARAAIYRSPPLHDALEDNARINLRRRIAELSERHPLR